MEQKLTPEQITDIESRVTKANDYLKQVGLSPQAVVQKIHIGEGMFVDKVIPYLQDTKHSAIKPKEDEVKIEKKTI